MESGRSGSCGYAAGPAWGGAHRPTGSRAIADKVERYAVAQAYQAFPNAGVYTAVSCLIQGIVDVKKRPAVFGEFKNTVMLGYTLRIAHSAHKRAGQEPGQGSFISGDRSAEAVLRILRYPFSLVMIMPVPSTPGKAQICRSAAKAAPVSDIRIVPLYLAGAGGNTGAIVWPTILQPAGRSARRRDHRYRNRCQKFFNKFH